ncbi:protein adenylyltransferase SelO family protein [Aliarcobacter cryaerophilus]|uniref:protein adenylyltransferase SelO family protein n=1 Tax=Aliarcobacter cryaerophilus TaxID=28198 RepID=UPI0021B53286|nr:protein adenylyltransferase SelO family protein [Aliarcobacter cryaerophilus]MCT7496537.1 protein adenylyltransferase SelO family protein [Aliarcobacter cryaerophilus]
MINENNKKNIETFGELINLSDYSFIENLNSDPDAKHNGDNKYPREVFSGHYVPVSPTAIKEPIYISHSKNFFKELGFSENLLKSDDFIKLFSGDMSNISNLKQNQGWATGYALSIYGREYYAQYPFQTGNGYGDGRAISVLEAVINVKRWEFQLKGGGKTPYCRGADGRAVLRSSVREFLAQEHMHFLGIPTSRSLTLFTSKKEQVSRPWFKEKSSSYEPEVMIEEDVAITTRVASSFLRVGQIELFGRRARKNEHKNALKELEMIVLHLIDREYSEVINQDLSLEEKIILLANEFQNRLTSLVANWIRVGYCQGNFNSDNCAAGGFTLDYGPFGFIEMFDPKYQSWTGGGMHFSFFNQPVAAFKNFKSFCSALKPLLSSNKEALEELEKIENKFSKVMQEKMQNMWASKLGLEKFDFELFDELINLMIDTKVDYIIFFRELSNIPDDINSLEKSFYGNLKDENIKLRWNSWLEKWKVKINVNDEESKQKLSNQMKLTNPKYTLREWHLVWAYKEAEKGNYEAIKELQEIMTKPYEEQTKEVEDKFYIKKPSDFFGIAGISHVSCSS